MYRIMHYGGLILFFAQLVFVIVYFFESNILQAVKYLIKNSGRQYAGVKRKIVGQSESDVDRQLTFELSDEFERMLSVELKASKADTKKPVPDMSLVMKNLIEERME